MRWKRKAKRVYYAEDASDKGFQAFVFSGECWLWAWAVYGRRFTQSGVTFSFARAKRMAADAIRERAEVRNER